MYAAQLRLPFVFPYFSQLTLLRGRAKRAANSQTQAVARTASARVSNDKDKLRAVVDGNKGQIDTLTTDDAIAFASMLAKAQEPGFNHRAELARLLSSVASAGESPDDLAMSLFRHLATVRAREAE